MLTCALHLNIVTILLYSGLIDLTEESELEAEEDEGSEVDDKTQAEYGSDDEHLTECFECQQQQVFCSAAGCLKLYCKNCANPDTDDHVQDFLLCAPQAVVARSSTVRSTKMHCISATAAISMYATSTCAHTVKSQLVGNAVKMMSVRTANKMTSACSKVLVVPCITQDQATICPYIQRMYRLLQ